MDLTPLPQNQSGDKPLRTLRAWVAQPYDDIMAYIWSIGLGDSVREAVSLKETRLTTQVHLPDGRSDYPSLVDFAVVEQEMDCVLRYFTPVALPLNDVSLVSPTLDSEFTRGHDLFRHYHVYTRYLRQRVRRDAEGQMPALVHSWYETRFGEIGYDIRQAYGCS